MVNNQKKPSPLAFRSELVRLILTHFTCMYRNDGPNHLTGRYKSHFLPQTEYRIFRATNRFGHVKEARIHPLGCAGQPIYGAVELKLKEVKELIIKIKQHVAASKPDKDTRT